MISPTQRAILSAVSGKKDAPSDTLVRHIRLYFAFVILILAFCSPVHSGDFLLNFQPLGNSFAPGNCGINGDYSGMCKIGYGNSMFDPDETPFFQGTVTMGGVSYWHVIVGDPGAGFAMESYIPLAGGFTSPSGGKLSDLLGWEADLESLSGNGWDPLGMNPTRSFDYTGNGSADPRTVVLRQVMGGEWDNDTKTWRCGDAAFCSEFLKEEKGFKPKIVQVLNDLPGEMISHFELDMSTLTYSDNTTAGSLINTLRFTSLDMPDYLRDASEFDASTDSQVGHASVTGGRYIYTHCAFGGSCWVDGSIMDYVDGYNGTWDFDEGSYSYVNGGTDVLNYKWDLYWNPIQNDIGPGNEAKCDSGIITGTCP